MARRKARFAKEGQIRREESRKYGLVSRGEDTRLQKDANARQQLFDETMEKVKQYEKDSDKTQKDVILMDFRKLRESILKLHPDEFSRQVLLESIWFSISVGNYQSYVPAIKEILDKSRRTKGFLTEDRRREVSTYLALHMVHFRDSERGIELFHNECDDETAARLIEDYMTGQVYQWLQQYKTLCKSPSTLLRNYASILEATGYHGLVEELAKQIQQSFFVIPKSVVETMTTESYEQLVKEYKLNWTLEGSTVTVRSRHK